MKRKTAFVLALFLTAAVFVVPAASAAVSTSDYLNAYEAYMNVSSTGLVEVTFMATVKNGANEVGAKKVVIYESKDGLNWSVAKRVTSESDPSLIVNAVAITRTVTYSGRPDWKYYAEVTFYAGRDGVGETRMLTVS